MPKKELWVVINSADSQESRRIRWRAFNYYEPLRKVLSYVSEHPGQCLSLEEGANIAAMSPTYFSNFFSLKVGVTFKHWMDLMRVNHAATLFCSSNKRIAEVMDECGFRDSTTFTRTFRRVMGITPQAFKQGRKPRERHRSQETPKKTKKTLKE